MTREKQSGGLDYFRLTAAFLVVEIHTSPFASLNADADFIFTRVFARTAVPFFFMATGYFLLPQYLFRRSMDYRPLLRTLKKLIFLYLAAILLYLPVNCYAGQLRGVSAGGVLRMLLTDGTFYHLWYLPAAIFGIVFVFFLGGYGQGKRISFGELAGISLVLYVAGLLGDSYYGIVEKISLLRGIYDVLFRFSSYTRNGLFYAPLFLVMGAGMHGGGRNSRTYKYVIGFAISLGLMIAEGVILHRLNYQRHDSMYLMLPAVMFFLFRLLLSAGGRQKKCLRNISLWIYLLHPLCMIAVRGAAKALPLKELFVDNSPLHYLAVCIVSFAAAVLMERCADRIKKGFSVWCGRKRAFDRGRAWIELSRENLRKNVEVLQGMFAAGQQLMAVVKADAYGHGAALIAGELQNMGVAAFGVACVSEGVSLRKNGITGDILILGYTHPKDFPLLRKYRLMQTVVNYAYGKALNSYDKKLNVHLKIDTGMHRLGERAERMEEIGRIFRLKNLKVEGIYTHLCADETRGEEDIAFTRRQAELFYGVAKQLKRQGYTGLKEHLLASYGLLHYPELGGDFVRVGIALYGLLSDRGTESAGVPEEERNKNYRTKLVPVLSLRARIAAVKEVYPGESVGYGCAYVAEDTKKIAVLAIGYGDGLPRSLSAGAGRVLIHGESAPVVGRICMDQMMVDVTGIADVRTGETATLIGRDGAQEITAYELAEKTGTITNEILSRLGARLRRVVV